MKYPNSFVEEFFDNLRSPWKMEQEARTSNYLQTLILDFVNEDSLLAAKTALFARHFLLMKEVPFQISASITKSVKKQYWVKFFITSLVREPTDICDILGMYSDKYGIRPIPNALKKGLIYAFNKFNSKQIISARKGRRGLSMIDAINLIHPKPTEENAIGLRSLVRRTYDPLAPHYFAEEETLSAFDYMDLDSIITKIDGFSVKDWGVNNGLKRIRARLDAISEREAFVV